MLVASDQAYPPKPAPVRAALRELAGFVIWLFAGERPVKPS